MSSGTNNSSTSSLTVADSLAKWTGTWKRTTTNFVFGGTFSRGKDTMSYITVEPCQGTDTSSIMWSFGSTTEAIRYGFTLLSNPLTTSSIPSNGSLSSTPTNSFPSSSLTASNNSNRDDTAKWIKLHVSFSANTSSSSTNNSITNPTGTIATNSSLLTNNNQSTMFSSTALMREDGMVLSLQLVQNALATIVYRMLDEDSK